MICRKAKLDFSLMESLTVDFQPDTMHIMRVMLKGKKCQLTMSLTLLGVLWSFIRWWLYVSIHTTPIHKFIEYQFRKIWLLVIPLIEQAFDEETVNWTTVKTLTWPFSYRQSSGYDFVSTFWHECVFGSCWDHIRQSTFTWKPLIGPLGYRQSSGYNFAF